MAALCAQEPPAHIPAFLPAFPDKHTYVATPAFAGNSKDTRRQRLDASKARRLVRNAVEQIKGICWKSLGGYSNKRGHVEGALAALERQVGQPS